MDLSQCRPAAADSAHASPLGGMRAVLEAFAAGGDDSALLLVVQTAGSTWSKPGQAMYVDADRAVGGLSGGCLEATLIDWARHCTQQRQIDWQLIDTRADEDRIVGSGLGCRGQLRLLALPRAALSAPLLRLLLAPLQQQTVELQVEDDGLCASSGTERAWQAWSAAPALRGQRVSITALPLCWLLGCGPESAPLAQILRLLGWRLEGWERRPHWRALGAAVDRWLDVAADRLPALLQAQAPRAVILASHSFELDHAGLQLLAASPPPFIGLLGPPSRRDELLSLLSPGQRERLRPSLHGPVGLDLGGRGAEAIALSIAAQLEQHRYGG